MSYSPLPTTEQNEDARQPALSTNSAWARYVTKFKTIISQFSLPSLLAAFAFLNLVIYICIFMIKPFQTEIRFPYYFRFLNVAKDDIVLGEVPSIVSNHQQLNFSESNQEAERENSNIPAVYWEHWNAISSTENRKLNVTYCDRVNLTNPIKLRYNNLYWQMFDAMPQNANEEIVRMYLYNAYYDDRVSSAPVVRLIGMNNQLFLGSRRKWWCLFWFDNIKVPALVKASDYYTIFPDLDKDVTPGVFHPQLISCPVPRAHIGQIPRAVSLQSRSDCNEVEEQPSNVLRVTYNRRHTPSTKPSIGVCVQAFRFATYDVSVRLIEWLEMIRLMGADKAYFYVLGANENLIKTLEHYSAKDYLVDWRRVTLPGEQVNVNSLYNLIAFQMGEHFWPSESLELNDCLYRNLYRHDYIAVIDIDEMIMPFEANNWHQLIESIENNLTPETLHETGYYSNLHSYFCEAMYVNRTSFNSSRRSDVSIPEHLYMMRHINRAHVLGKFQNNKCIHRTKAVMAVRSHLPMRCINTTGWFSCKGLTVNPNVSALLHYRRRRSAKSKKLFKTPDNCPINDSSIWRFLEPITQSVSHKIISIFG